MRDTIYTPLTDTVTIGNKRGVIVTLTGGSGGYISKPIAPGLTGTVGL